MTSISPLSGKFARELAEGDLPARPLALDDRPRKEFAVIVNLEPSLAPLAREIRTDRLEPQVQADPKRQRLTHAREYDHRACQRNIEKVLVVGEKQDLFCSEALDDVDVGQASQSKQNDVFDFPPLFAQLPHQGKRKVLIEEDFHPVRLPEAGARPRAPHIEERRRSVRV